MPKFSVVIPTQARADTLASALQTAVGQSYDDLEILVHESGDDPQTSRVVRTVGDHRTRHLKTGSPVSMTENWERALASTTGEYITFIGDDDGLLSDACSTASKILDVSPFDIITWEPATYFWPQHVLPHLRNLLHAVFDDVDLVEEVDPKMLLELCYGFREPFWCLPMVYRSFIKRDVAGRARGKLGRYFFGAAPDICSGVVNAYFAESCVRSRRPLSTSGSSHHSVGTKYLFSKDDSLRREAAASAFDGLEVHPTLVESGNVQLWVGNELLQLKDRIFPSGRPEFSYKNLLWKALVSLESGTEDKEATLREVREVAGRNAVSLPASDLPVSIGLPVDPVRGLRPAGPNAISIDIDCAKVGISNISEATRLVESLLPPSGPLQFSRSPLLSSVPAAGPSPVLIDFSSRGNGRLFLAYGWHWPESWGVWALGPRGELELRLDPERSRWPLLIEIEGRMFVHAGRPDSGGSVTLNGEWAADFRATLDDPTVKIRLVANTETFARSGAIVLAFTVGDPRSPAQEGFNPDPRKLGFGLSSVVVTALLPQRQAPAAEPRIPPPAVSAYRPTVRGLVNRFPRTRPAASVIRKVLRLGRKLLTGSRG